MRTESPIYKANFARFNQAIEALRETMKADHSTAYTDEFLNDVMTRYLEANGYEVKKPAELEQPVVVEETVE